MITHFAMILKATNPLTQNKLPKSCRVGEASSFIKFLNHSTTALVAEGHCDQSHRSAKHKCEAAHVVHVKRMVAFNIVILVTH